MLAEIVSACAGGAVLTGWALALECSPATIAILGALPFFAQLVQVPSAFLATRFGRKRVAVAAITLQRQIVLPLALLPFVSSQAVGRAILVAVAVLGAIAGVVANNAWVAWMGDLVPRAIRGRYFGGRTARCTLAGSLAALVAGLALDHARAAHVTIPGLAALAVASSIAGAMTTVIMLRQHDPTPPDASARLDASAALRPFLDPRVRPFLVYQVAWNAAVGLAAGLFTLHMLRDMRLGFAVVAAHGVATAAVRVIASPRWGRAIDRGGEGPVLVACSFGIAAVPLIWLAPPSIWLVPLILDPIAAGILWSGHALAAFALPLSVAPARERAFYLAAFSTAGGVAFALAAAIGGALVTRLPARVPGVGLHAIQVAFALSAVARLGAATLSLRIERASLARLVDQPSSMQADS